jgi:hypothetical protein
MSLFSSPTLPDVYTSDAEEVEVPEEDEDSDSGYTFSSDDDEDPYDDHPVSSMPPSPLRSILRAPFLSSPPSLLRSSLPSRRRQFRFNETVLVGETYGPEEYERKGDMKVHLTPTLAFLIRQELNDFKREMPVHPDSAHHTHFYH